MSIFKIYIRFISIKIMALMVLVILLLPLESKAGMFDNFLGNTLDSFTGDNFLYDLTAISATYLLIETNVDASVSGYFYNHEVQYYNPLLPGAIWGTISPFIIGGGLYYIGDSNHDTEMRNAAYAVLQASLINITFDILLKAITARPAPYPEQGNLKAQSETFGFKFYKGGIIDGWPSGHVSATAAVAFSLIHYYPDSFLIKLYGYTSVAYMMLTVTAFNGGRFHWFSDGVAGLIMGYTIGKTVGDYYRNGGIKTNNRRAIQYYSFQPLISSDVLGGQVTILF
jgi:membrane-associated phospholipid phosphatase